MLYKGALLVSFAVIFAIIALFLHARYKFPSQSAAENHSVFKAPIWLVGVFVIALLGAVNYKVQQFEDVLATGKPVILKIAPVDPRSLMQGDYMILNYAIYLSFSKVRFYLNQMNPLKAMNLLILLNLMKPLNHRYR